MIKHALLAMTLWFGATPSLPSTVDPLDGLSSERIDIELRDAPIGDVLLLAGDITGLKIEADPCVEGTATFALQSVPVRTLLETLADVLWLEYRRAADGTLRVGCRERDERSAAIDLQVVDASVADVVGLLARAGERTLDAEGCASTHVDLAMENASIDAVLSLLAARLNASLVRDGDHITLRCHSRGGDR